MTYFAWFLGLTVALLALLADWAWRSRQRDVTIDEFTVARAALESLLVWSPAVRRIFDPGDREFLRQARPEVERLFQQERKRLAISWLRDARGQITRLMSIHRKLSRCIDEPDETTRFDEFRLAIDYLSFIAVCYLLVTLVWLRGPFHARKMVGYTIGAADRFGAAFNRRLENINPAQLIPARVKFG